MQTSFHKHWWELARDIILEVKPRRILDIGAGEGMLWRGFGFAGRHNLRDPRVPFEWFDFNAHVVLLDIDAYKHPLDFVNASAELLPFPDKSFDLVIATEVIEHVVNPEAFAREIIRVGRAWVVTTPAGEEFMNEQEAERAFHSNPWLINLVREYPNDKYPHRGHKKVFTKEELERLFPNSQVFLIINDAPTPHWAVMGGLTEFIKENN
jgi:ubiquinone/menaquinone biosynthesis C-methylase UbiE